MIFNRLTASLSSLDPAAGSTVTSTTSDVSTTPDIDLYPAISEKRFQVELELSDPVTKLLYEKDEEITFTNVPLFWGESVFLSELTGHGGHEDLRWLSRD